MPSFRKVAIAVGILGAVVCCVAVKAGDSEGDARSEIDAFNKKFVELHLRMDTPGIMALWAEDGVDLMQGEAPIVGRKTITAWIEGVLANMPGYKVMKEEMEFHDIQVCERLGNRVGDGASGGASARREAEFRRIREDGAGAPP